MQHVKYKITKHSKHFPNPIKKKRYCPCLKQYMALILGKDDGAQCEYWRLGGVWVAVGTSVKFSLYMPCRHI
jgi:hypothetical protein